MVLDQLQRAARPHGLRFGPDPSTHSRCTIGGMIGNNSCGAHAMAYGTTAANVLSLDVLDGTGRRLRVGEGGRGREGGQQSAGGEVPGLDAFVAEKLEPLAGEFGRFRRQVSGYSLEHLLASRNRHLARALTGSEGTCCIVLGATVALVPVPAATALCVLGYPDMPAAADDAPALTVPSVLALEGIDARMVDVLRAHRANAAVPALPEGSAWLFAEVGGESEAEALAAARTLAASAGAVDSLVVPAGPEAATLWRIREDGAGLGSRTAAGAPAWPGWEDAAVPPERLGPYLREFAALMESHHLDGLLYGHFGDGCVHIRIDFPLADHAGPDAAIPDRGRPSGRGVRRLAVRRARRRPRPERAAADHVLAAGYRGVRRVQGSVRPGWAAEPRRHRRTRAGGWGPAAGRGPPAAGRRRVRAGRGRRRPVGGRAPVRGHGQVPGGQRGRGGFMCPSYLATRDEKDSTRGRARVLQELANGSLVTGGWRAPEVHEALDLCLSCKACSRDCPVSVDMATYKSEVLYRAYRRRLRPRSHYALGWLPRWIRLAAAAPGLANAALRLPPVAAAARAAAGIDQRRPLPASPAPADPASARAGPTVPVAAPGSGPPVVIWADTFTRAFAPQIAESAAAVLAEAGFSVTVPDDSLCCGLTWISTGQLGGARTRLRATVGALTGYVEQGMTIVGLEPSCTAVLRGDLTELLDGDPRARAVAGATRTLAETLLMGDDLTWLRGRLAGRRIIAQPHCHHHAVMGYHADLTVLKAAGAQVEALAGCCGLAGNFGMERGHYDVSVAVAGQALLPALRSAPEGTLLLADGFSCRTQASQLADWPARHLAELLDPRGYPAA